jgi:hypothetical protein
LAIGYSLAFAKVLNNLQFHHIILNPTDSKMAPVAQVLNSETSGNATVGALGRRKDGKPLKVRSYPKFDSLEEERLYRKQHLAAAYRVFADRGNAPESPLPTGRID